MLFGNRSHLAFEVEPIAPYWKERSVLEGPWVSLSIFVNGQCISRAEDPDTSRTRTAVYVPLLPIANFFIRNLRSIAYEETSWAFRGDGGFDLHQNLAEWTASREPRGVGEEAWEDLRYEWYRRHFWSPWLDGAQLPDLAFSRMDEQLCISWRNPRFAGPRRLQFVAEPGSHALPWTKGIAALRDFFTWSAQQAKARGFDQSGYEWLAAPNAFETSLACTSAQFLELVAPNARSVLQGKDLDAPEKSVALQALRDLDTSAPSLVGLPGLLDELESSTRRAGGSQLTELREEIRHVRGQKSAEQAGNEAARYFREKRGLDGKPLKTSMLREEVEQLATLKEQDSESRHNSFALGARHSGSAIVILLRNERTKKEWAERMELGRALGHLLLDPETQEGTMGAASSTVATGVRRRRSGAFAAELMLPEEGCRRILAGRDASDPQAFQLLLDEFRVGARTAAYQLWNLRLLPSPESRDALIDEFAAA